jgi:DNA-binding transcriptional regulator LsrR (DeoR family)
MNYLRCRAKILTFGEERKKQINELYYNQGKTTREIAKVERMSIRDISAILKEEEARRQKYKQQEISSKAYNLFSKGKRSVLFTKRQTANYAHS